VPLAIAERSIVVGTGGFVINGEDMNDNSGVSVSTAGDVNGDGLDDLIVGSAYEVQVPLAITDRLIVVLSVLPKMT
jgi:hypothetical protein